MLPLDTIIHGDCRHVLATLPENSIDLIFADPPYNLQLTDATLYRPNQTPVNGVSDPWDKFKSFADYDQFTQQWLNACRRVLKPNGTLWVIGSYHNIFRVGKALQDLGFWLLNDIVWVKHNPMPNFKGTRFTNAHETLIWAAHSPNARYVFNYKTMKTYNDNKQMRSDWYLPLCGGKERLKHNGHKAHATQKPQALLYRIITACSNPDAVVLDPFCGSGTTAAVAKQLGRRYIAIDSDPDYVKLARKRIAAMRPTSRPLLNQDIEAKPPRIPFGSLIERGIVKAGDTLFSADNQHQATILANGSIQWRDHVGSIHAISAKILEKNAHNGWTFWYIQHNDQHLAIDQLRHQTPLPS